MPKHRTKIRRLKAPSGMTGLWVEPWTKRRGEVYAVACANWRLAGSPVWFYGCTEWCEMSFKAVDFWLYGELDYMQPELNALRELLSMSPRCEDFPLPRIKRIVDTARCL